MLLPGLRRVVPVQRLARLMWATPRSRASAAEEQRIVVLAARLTRLRRGRRSNCLERSLLVYRFLSGAGADPHLVLGVGRSEGRVVGHAWITVGDAPVFESTESLDELAPVAAFGSRGTPIMTTDGSAVALPREWR
jgi:Transglutaminase-like superfamily